MLCHIPLMMTEEPDVMTTCLLAGQFQSTTLQERNSNISCLLVGSCKNSAHFPGSLLFPDTFLWIPFPCFSLADCLMLLGRY